MSQWWIASSLVWAVVLFYSLGGAFVAAFKPRRARRGDPMRLATFLVAFLFGAHPLRFLLLPTSLHAFKALYAVGILAALYVLRLMRAYGRGEYV